MRARSGPGAPTGRRARAQAALLVEWFRIAIRHGWIGSHRRRNTETPMPISGRRQLESLLRARDRHGLELPYGAAAQRAGYAANAPPVDPGGPDERPF